MEKDLIDLFSLEGGYLSAYVETFLSPLKIFRHEPLPSFLNYPYLFV